MIFFKSMKYGMDYEAFIKLMIFLLLIDKPINCGLNFGSKQYRPMCIERIKLKIPYLSTLRCLDEPMILNLLRRRNPLSNKY